MPSARRRIEVAAPRGRAAARRGRPGIPGTRFAREGQATSRYLAALVPFLRSPVGPREARVLVQAAQQHRERSFVTLLERAVFGNPRSPYLALLRHAGFDATSVGEGVRRSGVEDFLDRLHDGGVRISLAEFKGRQPILRPGLELHPKPEDFDNPLISRRFTAQTGGSTAAPRRLFIDLDQVEHEAAHLQLLLEALDVGERPQAAWFPPPPSVAGIKWALRHAKRGHPPERWFAQRPVSARSGEARFALFTAANHATAKLAGSRLPWPEKTPPPEAARVARWLNSCSREGTPAMLRTYPSSAVRVCQASLQERLDLQGTVFSLVGEPLTPAKHRIITRAGGRAVTTYYVTEAGQLGNACVDAEAPDDVHVLTERVVLSARAHELAPGHVVNAISLASLSLSTPKVLLNVESGDEGIIEQGECGCPIGALGLRVHVHSIRSYEKLVSEGMHFHGDALFELLEEVLPARFGGTAIDYQLAEHEEDGLSRVSLVVHPRIGPLDDRVVSAAVIEQIGSGGVAHAMMADVWRTSETLHVVRREPYTTPAGKTPPIHASRAP